MANIIKNELDDKAEVVYYLFRPDTLLKTIGDLTFLYNTTLRTWEDTKPIKEYISSGVSFKILDEKVFKELVEELSEDITMKTEISIEELIDMVMGRKKLNFIEKESHYELLPFNTEEELAINIKEKPKLTVTAIFMTILATILCGVFIIGIGTQPKRVQKESLCETQLKTVVYKIGNPVSNNIEDYGSSSKCWTNLDISKVDFSKPGYYLYTAVDYEGVIQLGTVIVQEKETQ